jgi:hypothetical protein
MAEREGCMVASGGSEVIAPPAETTRAPRKDGAMNAKKNIVEWEIYTGRIGGECGHIN